MRYSFAASDGRPARRAGHHRPGSGLFGLFVGAVPGLTATMATALLVPITFFMAPVAAIGAIVTATAMAIFAGDIPGTPAAHSRHPRLRRLYRRSLRDDPQGSGRTGAGRQPGVLRPRRAVRHGRPDRGGAVAGRGRAQVQLVRVFLAGLPGPDLRRRSSRRDRPIKGLVTPDDRAAGRDRRAEQPGGRAALHLRQRRSDGRHRLHPRDDRPVRRLGDPALRA